MNQKSLILIIDDEAHIRHVVSLKLQSAGYQVMVAEDGEEGLSLALEHQPDLVIMDWYMPFMTGLELCMKLTEHDQTRTIPRLMLSARGFGLSAEDLERANIRALLSKPFSPRELVSRVQELLQTQQTGAPGEETE